MYAELLIRIKMGKPYTGQLGSAAIDYEALGSDQDAISRKVKSLQSKKSRLNKLAAYDNDAKQELREVEAEIARLNELRPTVRITSKVAVKDINVDQLRAALKNIDVASLPADEQAKMQELMSKLG
jgi:predicted nuclease with TOPRIM domain